jgi:hypothetical protein
MFAQIGKQAPLLFSSAGGFLYVCSRRITV